jgi:hypothetical protein
MDPESDDSLKAWFEANYPKDEQPDITDEYGDPSDEDFEDTADALRQLQEENDRLKEELGQAKANSQAIMEAMTALTHELQRYQDASPLLYKLLTDLELDEYRATDYELMILPGTISTERNELTMEWILRRIYEGGPNDQGYDVDISEPY